MRQGFSRSVAIACMFAVGCYSPRQVQPPGGQQVRAGLDSLAAGRGDWATFSVTYDDLHGMHGGLTLTIHGDGRVEQKVLRMETRETRRVSQPDLVRLVGLLREVKAWEQITPERTAVPDESTSRLTVHYGSAETTVWEWYNDMQKNARIVRVRDLMTAIAWVPKAGQ